MLWSKQIYLFDVSCGWTATIRRRRRRRPAATSATRIGGTSTRCASCRCPTSGSIPGSRRGTWRFTAVTMALVDPDFAKENLWVLLSEQFQHPNGQLPAYEWEFSDLNPPVHAWACWRVYEMEKANRPEDDREFLERCFHKLLMNFAWWVNKVDSEGNNVFEGGFLGLDNITVIDRSEKLPNGAVLEQSDATGWMGFFCLSMMRIALELARRQQGLRSDGDRILRALRLHRRGDEEDGRARLSVLGRAGRIFLRCAAISGRGFHNFRLRSLVGLIPLYAVEVLRGKNWRSFLIF